MEKGLTMTIVPLSKKTWTENELLDGKILLCPLLESVKSDLISR